MAPPQPKTTQQEQPLPKKKISPDPRSHVSQPSSSVKPSVEENHKKHIFQKLKEKLKPKLPKEGLGESKSPQRRKTIPDNFSPKIDSFFQKKNINIESKKSLRKNSEMNFIVKVPSVVGRMSYFCKAKSKKRCDEKDLSAAYMEAQSKKLPLLFLYTNDLTKKAQEMMESGIFENSIIKKLE